MSRSASTNAARTLVSILNWNGTNDTVECLRALDRSASDEVRFFLLDNGSREDPSNLFQTEFPDIEYRREPINLGFTGGHNVAIRQALERGFGSILLLNNDCRIDIEGILTLKHQLEGDEKLGALSPYILRDDDSGRAVAVSGWFDWHAHRTIRPSVGTAEQPQGATPMVVGTALLLRCDALRKIGPLDERYFAYYEDDDISARLAAAGYRTAYCPDVRCFHPHRPIEKYHAMALYLMTRNSWLFWRTHTPASLRSGLGRHLMAQALHNLMLLKKNDAPAEKSRAIVAGLIDAMKDRYGRPPDRLECPALLHRLATLAPYRLSRLLGPESTVRP